MTKHYNSQPPKYVLETLSLGPKNSVLDRFDQNTVLAELDSFVTFCNEKDVPENLVTDIIVKTLAYIKKCKKAEVSTQYHVDEAVSKEEQPIGGAF